MNGRTIAHASSWAALGVIASKTLSLATAMVLARVLTPADFGLVALAAVSTELLQLVQDLGLSPAIVQQRGDVRAAATGAIRLHAAAAMALVVAVELGAGPIAWLLGDPGVAPIVRVLGLGILARGVGLVPRALLQRALAFRALATADVAGLIARAVVAVTLAWHGAGLWSLVAGDLAALSLQSGIAWVACGGVALRHPAAREAGASLLHFGRPMTLASVVIWSREGVTRALIGVLLGPSELGYFQMAARIAAAPITGITHVSNRVALPVYAATPDAPTLRRTFCTTLTIVSALALPICAVLLVMAPTVVTVCFGPSWIPAVRPLRLLLAASMASSLAATTGELFKALGRPADLLRTGLPHVGLLVVAIPLGALHGLAGVASAIAAVRITMATVALGLASRLTALPVTMLLAAIAPAIAGTCLMLLALATMTGLAVEPARSPAIVLATHVCVAAMAYALGFLTWRRATAAWAP